MAIEELNLSQLATRERLFVMNGSETVSGYKQLQTGLSEVIGVWATLDQFPTATHMDTGAAISDQSTEPGQIELYVTIPTSISTNATPTTAATAAKVSWIAIGAKPGLM
jgi:hypothetical protein